MPTEKKLANCFILCIVSNFGNVSNFTFFSLQFSSIFQRKKSLDIIVT